MLQWKPVGITTKKVVEAKDGFVTLSIALNNDQSFVEWEKRFELAAEGRQGSLGYIKDPGPTVRGQEISWTVPEADMEDAVRYVRAKIEAANRSMAQYVEESKRAMENANAAERVKQSRVAELQERLDQI
jgi:hypothetical protein